MGLSQIFDHSWLKHVETILFWLADWLTQAETPCKPISQYNNSYRRNAEMHEPNSYLYPGSESSLGDPKEGVLLSFSRVPWVATALCSTMDICPSLSSFWNLGTSRSTHALPLRHPTSFRARVDGSIHRSNVKASRTSCNSATDMACNARETTRSKWWLTGQLFYNSWMEIKWSFHRLLGLTWAIQGLFHGSLWFTWSCRYPTSSYETRGTCRATMATPKPFQLLPILGGNIWKVSTTVLDWTWVGKGLIVFSHLIHYALNQVFLSGHRWLWGPRSSSLICHSGYI